MMALLKLFSLCSLKSGYLHLVVGYAMIPMIRQEMLLGGYLTLMKSTSLLALQNLHLGHLQLIWQHSQVFIRLVCLGQLLLTLRGCLTEFYHYSYYCILQ